jgi:hypothetical protein
MTWDGFIVGQTYGMKCRASMCKFPSCCGIFHVNDYDHASSNYSAFHDPRSKPFELKRDFANGRTRHLAEVR